MRKFAFVILLFLPLIGFGQAEKHYRSIIIDSVKALNGGRVDIKDTLLLDSLAVYNTDLSSQYTSRSLVDSAFVGVAVSSGGVNTIYSADDNLAGNRTVTMGTNNLLFSSTGEANLLKLDATANRARSGLWEFGTVSGLATAGNSGYTITSYAVLQFGSGQTVVNSATAQSISFRIANSEQFAIEGNKFKASATVGMKIAAFDGGPTQIY